MCDSGTSFSDELCRPIAAVCGEPFIHEQGGKFLPQGLQEQRLVGVIICLCKAGELGCNVRGPGGDDYPAIPKAGPSSGSASPATSLACRSTDHPEG
jgi:hypothetical protein